MVVVTIYCGIAGVASRVFYVEIDETKSVDHLKVAIKEANTTTIKCDAWDLHLFLAKKDGGEWVTVNDVKTGLGITKHMKLLGEGNDLRDVDLTEENMLTKTTREQREAGLGEVHVLVLLPTVTICYGIASVPGNGFSVTLNENDSVEELLKKIAEGNPSTIQCDAKDLELFLAKKDDDNWVTESDVNNGVAVSAHMKKLNTGGMSRLRTAGLSVMDVLPKAANGQIESEVCEVHVLVKLPSAVPIRAMKTTEFDQYIAVAENLKDSEGTKNLVSIIKRMQKEVDKSGEKQRGPSDCGAMPFIVLENSSGTGKTQMAFNLQATGDCDVFHVLCSSQGDQQQSVYGALKKRSEEFRRCIEEDAREKFGKQEGVLKMAKEGSVDDFGRSPKLLIYGYIIAALSGAEEFSGLEATRQDVENALKKRHEKTGHPFVFFLDEFPRVDNLKNDDKKTRTIHARMMRNVFRSFDILAVASATNGTARDLVTTSANSRVHSSSGQSTPWCVVVPSLPEFAFTEKIENMRLDPSFVWILKHSRPLFALRAVRYMKQHPYDSSRETLLEYLTCMTKELAVQFRALKASSAAGEFEQGQFYMLLCTSYHEVDGRVNLIDGHYGCLQEGGPFTVVFSGDQKGLFKMEERGRVRSLTGEGECNTSMRRRAVSAPAVLELVPEVKDEEEWRPRCRLPLPEEDILLHLTLMIDHYESGRISSPLKHPVHKEWKEIDVSNTAQRSNDGMTLEALVAAAVVLASHRGGYGGVKFPRFLGRLLYELGVQDNPQGVKKLPNDLKKDTMIPFLSMPNTKWPVGFLDHWQGEGAMFANMIRTANKDRIHFAVPSTTSETHSSESQSKEFIISGECKDRKLLALRELKAVLRRVPEKTEIHLLTVRGLQDSYFKADKKKPATESKQLPNKRMRFTKSGAKRSKQLAAKRRGTAANAKSDASLTAETNLPIDQMAAAPKSYSTTSSDTGRASKPPTPRQMSASEYLKSVKLQHADFYRISRSGKVQEFTELMKAKAAGDGTKESGAGKLILFVEVGAITARKRRA